MSEILVELGKLTQAAQQQTAASQAQTAEVAGKMAQIDQKVTEATSAVPQAVTDAFALKAVHLDPESGNDANQSGPFKTLGAAVSSIPDGGSIIISFVSSEEQKKFIFSEAVYIGSRKVTLVGGYSGMESQGLKPWILKPIVDHDTNYNRTRYKGYFVGKPGGEVLLSYCLLELPRIVDGTSIEHHVSGSFMNGDVAFKVNNTSLTGPHIYIEEGSTRPMWLAQSSGRDNKGSIAEIGLTYTSIETALATPLFNLQYGSATMRFSHYALIVSDADGAVIGTNDLFEGLSYGDHGYATNLLANESTVKQTV